MTTAPKRFPLGLDDLVRAPASKHGKPAGKTSAQGGNEKANIGVKTATKATVAHAGFDSKKRAAGPAPRSSAPSAPPAAPRSVAGAASARAPIDSTVRPPVPAQARTPSDARASTPRISTEQRTRAAVLATEHARPAERARAQTPARAAPPTPPRAVATVNTVTASVKPAAAPNPLRVSPSSVAPAHFSLTSERVRERMVERVRANGVSDPRVLAAMAAVPRHLFVDPGFATQAYEEAALPIGHHQTISKPSVVARMIELAANGRVLENVLEIGTGCGYQAAVLSGVARDVYSIERIRPLYERAKHNLRPLRIPNIRLHYGDGRLGMPNVAPFDAIVIAAAGLDVPQALLEQLQIGGRLVAPVGAESQVLTLVERVAEHQWHESQLDRVFFVPLKSGVI
ncbi:protein-L-isoaspartate(D-aspartate) O-methyltransferase [Pararobbsia silviterrae]|uniref:Protein-L-isoaspartate O-methyltransferase n=1 Tax=Pararobbsia silviterrae TaxID=1792498 RepID=A0A494XY45_9BURK|nr:protein-L-isoaspartate(D-aspartate) O-methyltransferase [Pararobbsia silviterrae]RKP54865.1 protein-L-isoaspartate(D-aspartate) O-methyltransferase [Pararobbsia silviterrae]